MRLHLRSVMFGLILGFILVAGLGKAKGEFRREVPKWFVRPALCVHHFEGSWRDPNGPYYGGMQLSLAWQRRYGGWILRRHGTADNWSPRTQLLVAWRGFKAQGYSWRPWPNTARACGLL